MGSVWAEMGLAIAAPALLILLMPRRWLGRTILLWIVSPLIVYVAVLLWEVVTRPPSSANTLGNAVYGFMLLSSILALPWLIGCALGFAIGFGLRRLFRRSAPSAPSSGPPLATPQPNPPILRLSPDGMIRVEVEAVEWGSSRWVYSPRVIDVPTGRVVLDLWNTDWDATIHFPGPRRVELGLRRYHEGEALSADLDLERGTYRVASEHGHEAPLSGIVAGLEEAARRTVVANGWMAQPAIIPPKPWAAWRMGLVIFVGAFVAIGAAAYLTERYKAENRKPPVLDTVPRLDPPPIRR